jgi:hypothetical protein
MSFGAGTLQRDVRKTYHYQHILRDGLDVSLESIGQLGHLGQPVEGVLREVLRECRHIALKACLQSENTANNRIAKQRSQFNLVRIKRQIRVLAANRPTAESRDAKNTPNADLSFYTN